MNGEYYEISRYKADRVDRYKNCSILVDKETQEKLISTREIYDIPSNSNDIYHRLQSHEVGRLDLLAHKYYRNPLLWWIIAQANEIYDPLEYIEVGTLLRIPSIETLYGSRGILL